MVKVDPSAAGLKDGLGRHREEVAEDLDRHLNVVWQPEFFLALALDN